MDEYQMEAAERAERAARDANVQRIRQMAQAEQHPDFDGSHCTGCDGDIPPARLAMGKVRCVPCQQTLEKRNAHTRT